VYESIAYIQFLLKSTNQHGVHSPFVYNLITKCFYDKTRHKAYPQLSAYRDSLLKTKTKIKISDFGSGSRVFKSNQRVIAKMAQTSGTSLTRAKLLFRLVNYLKPKNSLELGTHLGIATHALAIAAYEHQVVSVEGCPQTSEVAKTQLEAVHIKNVLLKTGPFEEQLPQLKQQEYDLVFFDGNHTKEATLNYFEELINAAHNDSVFIFDDIHWSKGMTEAWEQIKAHPKVTVTIDTFFWGLVFFRSEQQKEHFKIRV